MGNVRRTTNKTSRIIPPCRLRKNPSALSFRGAEGDEESRKAFIFRARFLATLGMTRFRNVCRSLLVKSSGAASRFNDFLSKKVVDLGAVAQDLNISGLKSFLFLIGQTLADGALHLRVRKFPLPGLLAP